MADFGVNATDLQGPQGAGSQPVPPTQEQFVPQNWGQALKSIGATVGGVADAYIKSQQLAAKNAILGELSQNESLLNQARDQGSMTDAEADARSRAKFNQVLAAHPELATEISGIRSAFKATTSTGTRDTELEQAQAQRKADDDFARQQGFRVTPNMSEGARDAQIQAAYAGFNAQKQLDAFYKEQAYSREQGTYDQNVADRKLKDLSFNLTQDIATKNITAMNGHVTSLLADVQANRVTPEAALIDLNAKNASLQATLQVAAQRNPELAAAWKPIFDEQYRLGQELLKPGADTQRIQDQLNGLLARQNLMNLQQNPKLLNLAATNKLFPNSPVTSFTSASEVSKLLLQNASTPVTNGVAQQYTPQIAGNPEVESAALTSLKGAISNLSGGKIKAEDQGQANVEASNVINNLLVQTARFQQSGQADATKLKGLADFFASPQYAYLVSHGKIDPQAAQAAKYTFQSLYEPAVVQAMGNQLKAGQTGEGSASVASGVDVKYTGSGLVFTSAQGQNISKDKLAALNQTQTALNTLVHLGAHMEGTTDYQKYWDNNKHLFLPQVYPDPAKLKVGQVVNGRKYIGGNYQNPNNWTTDGVNSGTAK